MSKSADGGTPPNHHGPRSVGALFPWTDGFFRARESALLDLIASRQTVAMATNRARSIVGTRLL
jgi:hypothetical protein